jgi:uncharacterized protein YukE
MTADPTRIMLLGTHPERDSMKANADPDALDSFSNELVRFIDTLGDAQTALDSQFDSLKDNWDDPQSQQFEQELAELRTVLQRFQASASEHVPYLRALASRLRDYLQT